MTRVKDSEEVIVQEESNTISPEMVEFVTDDDKVVKVSAEQFRKAVAEGKERQEDLDKKVDESPRRMAIEKRKQELDFITSTLGQQSEPISYYGTPQEEQAYEISQIEMQPLQQQMPVLPQIFQTQLPIE